MNKILDAVKYIIYCYNGSIVTADYNVPARLLQRIDERFQFRMTCRRLNFIDKIEHYSVWPSRAVSGRS